MCMSLRNVIAALRYISGNATVTTTASVVFKALAEEDIPAFYCGGLALSTYGYVRNTDDVDIIIPNTYKGRIGDDILWQCVRPVVAGGTAKFVCKRTGGGVDFLYGGNKHTDSRLLTYPKPTVVTSVPVPIPMAILVGLKLDAARDQPIDRAKDRADVIELIKRGTCPRDLPVPNKTLQTEYVELWDAVNALAPEED